MKQKLNEGNIYRYNVQNKKVKEHKRTLAAHTEQYFKVRYCTCTVCNNNKNCSHHFEKLRGWEDLNLFEFRKQNFPGKILFSGFYHQRASVVYHQVRCVS